MLRLFSKHTGVIRRSILMLFAALAMMRTLLSAEPAVPTGISASPLPSFDFTNGADAQGWVATHDIASFTPSRDGLVVKISGNDAFMHSPRGDFSARGQLVFTATLRSPEAGWGQVFFSKDTDSEAHRARECRRWHLPIWP